MAKRRKNRKNVASLSRTPTTILTGIVIAAAAFLIWSATSAGVASAPVAQDRLELDPIRGNPEAPITLVEYGAYGCSACRAWHQAEVIDQILAEYPDQVRFVFRDFPVIYPTYDRMAAEIAHCALDQGQESFWALHHALYTTIQPGSSREDILQAGERLVLDGAALRACADANTHRATVQFQETRARRLGLPGTPSFMVNDARVFNASPQVLLAEIAKALQTQH